MRDKFWMVTSWNILFFPISEGRNRKFSAPNKYSLIMDVYKYTLYSPVDNFPGDGG